MKRIFLAIGLLMALTAAAPAATPVVPVPSAEARLQSLEIAEAARKDASVKAAEKRDIDDLDAQRRMAIAADRMADLTLAQVVVGIMGALFVGFSIFQSNKALAASTTAVDQNAALMTMTQRHAELQLMAYPEVTSYELKHVHAGTWEAVLVLTNKGQTPALNIDIKVTCEQRQGTDNDIQWQDVPDGHRMQVISRLVPDGDVKPRTRFDLSEEHLAQLSSGAMSLWYRAEIVFEDVFDKRFRMRFSALIFGEKGKLKYLCRHGNDVVELPNG